MKKKDAFALRGFDEKNILQRPFFKGFCLKPTSDKEILTEYGDLSKCANAAAMEDKMSALRDLYSAVAKYRRLIIRHRARLRKYFSCYDSENDTEKWNRAAGLRLKYNWFEEAAELFELRFGRPFVVGERAISLQRRREFANRLRRARKESGMTQAQLAANVGMSQGGYTQYETARREPSLSTLVTLSKALRRPTDWFLGLT